MKRVTNKQARVCVQRCEEFKGANTFGEHVGEIYVVYSYGKHWPLFVFVGGQWLENEDRYSVTTSKHRSQLHPLVDTQKRSCSALKSLVAAQG